MAAEPVVVRAATGELVLSSAVPSAAVGGERREACLHVWDPRTACFVRGFKGYWPARHANIHAKGPDWPPLSMRILNKDSNHLCVSS